MATKRFRSGKWYYQVKHSLLQRPLYVSFTDEAAGDAYIKQLEGLLKRGVVPETVAQRTMPAGMRTVGALLEAYRKSLHLPESDKLLIVTLEKKIGDTRLPLTFEWVQAWVTQMKEIEQLSPSTIRHYVGAASRAIDWQVRAKGGVNPIKLLPKRYARYVDGTVIDKERDRRLHPGEHDAIMEVLRGRVPDDRQRALRPDPDLTLVYQLGLETAMRLREIYTLEPSQVNLFKKTVFLDKSKNGDNRQVPLSSVACSLLQGFKGFPWHKNSSQKELRRVTSLLSRRFSTAFGMAKCEDLNFHDLRHEATCRLYERTSLSDVQIARITGHKDLRVLRRYASLRGSDLAEHLW